MAELLTLDEVARISRSTAPGALALDEDFWARFAGLYDRDPGFIQLNYGYYHPSLRPVLEVELAAVIELNRRGSHFKWKESASLLEAARADLAGLAGVAAEEVVITRNTSESMNVVIRGLALEPGDEVVCSDQDYGGMDQAWEQRVKHDGIVLRRVALPLDPVDDDEVVRCFEAQVTPRTRLVHVTHLIHLTGQVLPVQRLCRWARGRGLPVLVDAAHSFAQIDFSIRELGCDYLAASLHKWLGAPLGTGLLYVREDRIRGLQPLFGDTQHAVDDIRRLEHLGNRPDSAHAGLREAIRWHLALGTAAKQARLASLQRRWTEPVRAMPRFQVLTPRGIGRYGALGLVNLEGVPPAELFDYLFKTHGLFTAVQKNPVVSGLRLTVGLPTSPAHLARLLEALQAAARHFAH